jgi:hypothetical protein
MSLTTSAMELGDVAATWTSLEHFFRAKIDTMLDTCDTLQQATMSTGTEHGEGDSFV